MDNIIHCPTCGAELDITEYCSMMVVSQKTAMFTVKCPDCGAMVPSIHRIPESLRCEVEKAALDLGAGMGRGE